MTTTKISPTKTSPTKTSPTKTSLLAKFGGGLSAAVLAIAFSFGGPAAVRAEDPEVLTPSLQELVVGPIMQAVEGLEQRLTYLEASVGTWADSIMTRRLLVQEICVADEGGAQTCISKGQLDALLRNVAHAEIESAQPPIAVTEAAPPPSSEEVLVVASPVEETAIPEAPLPEAAEVPQAQPEIEQTGSVNMESPESEELPRAALVSVPDVETTIAVEAPEAE